MQLVVPTPSAMQMRIFLILVARFLADVAVTVAQTACTKDDILDLVDAVDYLSDVSCTWMGDVDQGRGGDCRDSYYSTIYEGDCSDIAAVLSPIRPRSGVYRVKLVEDQMEDIDMPGDFNIYCEFNDEGNWTVFQRRYEGELNFNKPWQDYKRGFGDLTREFWLGLEMVSAFTNNRPNMLQIDMEDWKGNKRFAIYHVFVVAPESDSYRLLVEDYEGDAGDSWIHPPAERFAANEYPHAGMPFVAVDGGGGEEWDGIGCSYQTTRNGGGWWYNSCMLRRQRSNLNGAYRNYDYRRYQGVLWYTFANTTFSSLRRVQMKMRPAETRLADEPAATTTAGGLMNETESSTTGGSPSETGDGTTESITDSPMVQVTKPAQQLAVP